MGGVEIDWITAEPCYQHLINRGIRPLDISRKLISLTVMAEEYIEKKLLYRPWRLKKYLQIIKYNSIILNKYLGIERYDYIFMDEFWELVYYNPKHLGDNILFATDFIFKKYSLSPIDNLSSYIINNYFTKIYPQFRRNYLIGLEDDIPRQKIGFVHGESMLEWAKRNFRIVGRIPSLDKKYRSMSKEDAKSRLGIPSSRIVVTLFNGGTKASSIEFQRKIFLTFKILQKHNSELYFIAILGPRAPTLSIKGIDIKTIGYVTDPGPYLAASDVVISRPGRTSVTDLLYLGIPSLLIPLPNHFEQEHIALIESKRNGFIEYLPNNSNIEDIIMKIRLLLDMDRDPPSIKYFIGSDIIAKDIAKVMVE
jgi:hypothetical protein